MFISKVSPVLCLIAIFFYLLCVSLSLFLRFSLSRIIANDTLRDDETDIFIRKTDTLRLASKCSLSFPERDLARRETSEQWRLYFPTCRQRK